MAETHIVGITAASFKMGDVGATGGMGASLTALPATVKGTFKFNTTAPTVAKYYTDLKPRPVQALATGNIDETVEFSFYDTNSAVIVKFFGGTSTPAVAGTSGDKFEAPATVSHKEQSFEWKSKNGTTFQIVRGLVTGNLECTLGEDGIWMVKAMVTVLEPTDGTSKAWNYVHATPPGGE